MSSETLAAYDVVILDQVARPFEADEAAAFADWVRAGGAVMALSGFSTLDEDWQDPDSFLADLALQYDSSLYLQDTESGACPGYVTGFAPHPVTAGLREVAFCGGHGVVLTGTCDGPTQPVAFAEDASVGSVCEQGAGRVYLWGDEWVEYSSTWGPGTDSQQFWQDAIDWLTHRT